MSLDEARRPNRGRRVQRHSERLGRPIERAKRLSRRLDRLSRRLDRLSHRRLTVATPVTTMLVNLLELLDFSRATVDRIKEDSVHSTRPCRRSWTSEGVWSSYRAATLAAVPVGESSTGENCPVVTVVISSGGKGDRPVGSLEVNVSVGSATWPGRIRQGG
jgi:hypothetical protein